MMRGQLWVLCLTMAWVVKTQAMMAPIAPQEIVVTVVRLNRERHLLNISSVATFSTKPLLCIS